MVVRSLVRAVALPYRLEVILESFAGQAAATLFLQVPATDVYFVWRSWEFAGQSRSLPISLFIQGRELRRPSRS